jgi:uncharacterized protein (TIGR02145 family)
MFTGLTATTAGANSRPTTAYTAALVIVAMIIVGWGCGGGKRMEAQADSSVVNSVVEAQAGSAVTDSAGEARAGNVAGARTWDCGDKGGNVTATLKSGGTLVVRGAGAIADYESYREQFAPWYNIKDSITGVVIEDGVTSVGRRAFLECTNLTSVKIPGSMEKIGDEAFQSCSGLTSVTIPDRVRFIGMAAFASTGLTSATIPDSVRVIPGFMFAGCENLTSVTIPGGVWRIGEFAFSGCISLTSVTIPKSVWEIEMHAFSDCIGLVSVIIPNPSPPHSIGINAFGIFDTAAGEFFKSSACLYVPAGSIGDYRIAGTWEDFKCVRAIASASGETPEIRENRSANKKPETETRGNTFTDSRDGKKYRTVKIGEKTWMAENLNHKTGRSWCFYHANTACDEYGRLYDWNTAMSACPKGWRLPARGDWDDLCKAAGGTRGAPDDNGNVKCYGAGKKLKSKSGWYENRNGTDDYGFSALPGGYRYDGGSFRFAEITGGWWTATEGGLSAFHRKYRVDYAERGDTVGAYMRYMDDSEDDVGELVNYKECGYSVRCVRDAR